MAARRGTEESKQGLIIALVIFVILTIGLGVATYYGFAGQAALEEKAKQAKADADAKASSRDWHRFQNEVLKAYIGHTLTKEDSDHLAANMPKFEGNSIGSGKDDNKPDFDNVIKDLNAPGYLGWDQAKKLPAKTFKELTKEKDESIANLTNQLNQARQNVAKLEADLANTKKSSEDSQANLRKELEKSNKEKSDLVNAYETKYKEYWATVEKLQNDVDDIKKREDRTKDDSTKQLARLSQDLKDIKTQLEREKEKTSPPDVVDFDKPKGKIIDIERGGQVVYVNLGSADNVKPQLTFSLYSAGAAGRGGQRKGAIEITNLLGPHLAKARVTELTDSLTNPVVRGDLLFNPAWNSAVRQHVSIAGLIDLAGTGTDDTQEFIRSLERQNVVVDSFIDLKDLAVKGPGMSLKTQYLILGDSPELLVGGQVSQLDIRTEKKNELIKKMTEMKREAERLGVTVIPFRRFLAVTGYQMPRGIMSRSGSTYLDSVLLGREAPPKQPTTPPATTPEQEK